MTSPSVLLISCGQLLGEVFLKFPSAEGCFRDELQEVVCKFPAAEERDSNESGLEAGATKQGALDRMGLPDTVISFALW